jgi:hypothetical protein
MNAHGSESRRCRQRGAITANTREFSRGNASPAPKTSNSIIQCSLTKSTKPSEFHRLCGFPGARCEAGLLRTWSFMVSTRAVSILSVRTFHHLMAIAGSR